MNNSRRAAPWRMASVALAALAVSGCGAFERKVEYVPYNVPVPIEVPCAVQPVDEPKWATSTLQRSDSLDDKAKALLEERVQRMGYEAKLKAAAEGCK